MENKQILMVATAAAVGIVIGIIAYKLFSNSVPKVDTSKSESNFSSACGCGG